MHKTLLATYVCSQLISFWNVKYEITQGLDQFLCFM
jgi:hypothetical protein